MGNGILIIGPCSSRRGMPYPQADTIMIHESATFSLFVSSNLETNKQTNKKSDLDPGKNGASLWLQTIGKAWAWVQYYEAAKFPSGQSALVNVWFLVSKQRFLGRNTNHKLVNSFLHKTWSSLYHDGIVKSNFKSLKWRVVARRARRPCSSSIHKRKVRC